MPEARISDLRIHYHLDDGFAIVRPDGACDAKTTEALARLVNSSLIQSRNLIIDLSRCEYVETPGYRWLVRELRNLEAAGKTLVAAGLQPRVERVFKLLHFDKMIPVAKDVPEAMDKVRAKQTVAA